MRRRDFLCFPAAVAALPCPPHRLRLATLRLDSLRPLSEFSTWWALHGAAEPLRIVARPHPLWWPSPANLPERWQAWFDLSGGAALIVICEPLTPSTSPPPATPDLEHHCPVTRRLAAALTSAAPADA